MVECPVCKMKTLVQSSLEEGLSGLECTECGGFWVEYFAYQNWREGAAAATEKQSVNATTAEQPDVAVELRSGERAGVKFCPQCHYILVKYKVGHNLGFHLDRCGHCGGVWFDKNEWQLLKDRHLHDHIHQFFSQEWQSQIRAEEHEKAMKQILLERLGQADFEQFEKIRTWLDSHPKSDELYALLMGSRQQPQSRARSLNRVSG